MGDGAKAEDILRVMEAVGGVALKFALEKKEGISFGFNKKNDTEESDSDTIGSDEC